MKNTYITWVEIDLKAIRHNFRAIRELALRQFSRTPASKKIPPSKRKCPEILSIIKADAYGHGMAKVASVLNKMGAGSFGVSDVREGMALRKIGIKKPILLLETPLPLYVKDVIDYNLTPTVCTLALASALNNSAKKINRQVDVHIKVDTGMGRLGVLSRDAEEFIDQVMSFPFLSLKGVYTHFPLADTNCIFTQKQIEQLADLIRRLDRQAKIVPFVHAANSMGLGGYKTQLFNSVRPGLMLYGLYPSPALIKKIKLQPAMSVKTRIIFIKKIPKGQGVSYGHIFKANKDMTIAILPIGYNDGYFRCLSNKSQVLVAGKRCPVVGRVTMDQIIVDISRIKAPKIGMQVTLLGREGKENISADELAQQAQTINYEIVCSLGNRLPRVYKG